MKLLVLMFYNFSFTMKLLFIAIFYIIASKCNVLHFRKKMFFSFSNLSIFTDIFNLLRSEYFLYTYFSIF